jgi:hypothetical protein
MNPAVQWLEAWFDEPTVMAQYRMARERGLSRGTGRPMFELLAQQDDQSSWASWPTPYEYDDLDAVCDYWGDCGSDECLENCG